MHICINFKPIVFMRALEAGLETLNQLFDVNGNFKDLHTLSTVYNLTHYQCIQLWFAIPRQWKDNM